MSLYDHGISDFWLIYFHLPVMWGHPVFEQHSAYICVFFGPIWLLHRFTLMLHLFDPSTSIKYQEKRNYLIFALLVM